MASENNTDNRHPYEEQVEARLRELDAEIELLRAKADRMKADASATNRDLIAELTKRRETVADRLSEYRDAADSALSRIKDGVDQAMGDLSRAVNDASTAFGREDDQET
jgi:F0F1-type ATP synthase membrane subunit b/b'